MFQMLLLNRRFKHRRLVCNLCFECVSAIGSWTPNLKEAKYQGPQVGGHMPRARSNHSGILGFTHCNRPTETTTKEGNPHTKRCKDAAKQHSKKFGLAPEPLTDPHDEIRVAQHLLKRFLSTQRHSVPMASVKLRTFGVLRFIAT